MSDTTTTTCDNCGAAAHDTFGTPPKGWVRVWATGSGLTMPGRSAFVDACSGACCVALLRWLADQLEGKAAARA